VRARLLSALLLAFALLAAPAPAQVATPTPTVTPTPTPTPTPEPRPERSDEVRAIYRDYRREGELQGCRHERADLKDALKGITDGEDMRYPDLRYLLQAAIDEHKSGDCEEQAAEEEEEDDTDSGTDTTGSGTTGSSTTGSTGTTDSTGTTVTPDSTTIPPAEAATPAPTPVPVYSNADDGVPVALVVLAALLGVLALLVALFALLSRAGYGERVLAGPRRAWSEAAFRAGGTWGDFADWIRVGR
jgi:hypothetical protein